MVDWSSKKVLAFIEDYRKCPELWDATTSEYHTRSHKVSALNVLSAKYNCDVKTIQKRIKNLRCAFHREYAKINGSNRRLINSHREPKAQEKDNSTWYAYNALKFILDGIPPLQMRSPQHVSVEDATDNNVNLEDCVKIEEPNLTEYNDNSNNNDSDELDPLFSTNELPEPTDNDSKPIVAVRKKSKISTYLSTVQTLSRKRKTTKIFDDDCDITGKKLACDLRKICEHQRIFAEKIISEVIYYAKLGYLTETSCCSINYNENSLH